MASQPEVPVHEKREVEKKQESTVRSRAFVPVTDIFETEQALSVILEMPGVAKENVEIGVENDVLTIEGRIDYSAYEGLQPIYTEYNVGHYVRSFQLSNKIEQSAISAEMKDGVMTLRLPKAEKAKPRKITVS
jgi:HSP20 family molecular chaperone IbpA